MANEAEDKLEELLKSGKISEEEYAELKNLISNEKKDAARVPRWDSVKAVDIHLFSIDVEIKGWEENFVKISEGPEHLIVEKEGDRVKIHSKKRIFSLGSILNPKEEPAKITVFVPNYCNIDTKTVSGDVNISNLSADVKIKSVSGDLTLKGINGRIEANTVSGDIKVKECKGRLNVEAKSGNVLIDNSDISGGSLKTYSGDVSIVDSKISDVDATLYSGDFALRSPSLKGNASVKTMLGDITCDGIGKNIKFFAETKSGDIKLSDSGKNFLVRGEFAVYENGKTIEKEKLPSGSRLVREGGDFSLRLITKKGDIFIKI